MTLNEGPATLKRRTQSGALKRIDPFTSSGASAHGRVLRRAEIVGVVRPVQHLVGRVVAIRQNHVVNVGRTSLFVVVDVGEEHRAVLRAPVVLAVVVAPVVEADRAVAVGVRAQIGVTDFRAALVRAQLRRIGSERIAARRDDEHRGAGEHDALKTRHERAPQEIETARSTAPPPREKVRITDAAHTRIFEADAKVTAPCTGSRSSSSATSGHKVSKRSRASTTALAPQMFDAACVAVVSDRAIATILRARSCYGATLSCTPA